MQSELNVFVELADTWETIEGNSDQRAVYRECADGLRMMVDFKRQQIDAGLQPDRAPTHRCTVCGAFWMKWKDSWSLCSKQCGKCCDNVAMCDQIVPLIVSDIYAPAAEITRLTEALRRNMADHGRLIWKDEAQSVCPSTDDCFEYSDTVRCGPCAIKMARNAGVEPNMGLPNLPEVSRLSRENARLTEALRAAEERAELLQDGWVLVPEEPTWEMLEAARDGVILSPNMDALMKRGLRANWKAMIRQALAGAKPC